VVRYAGFWIRFGAYFVDALICGIVTRIVILAVQIPSTSNLGSFIPVFVFGFYHVLYLTAPQQATPGMRLFRIKVTDLNGRRISFGRAVIRFLAMILFQPKSPPVHVHVQEGLRLFELGYCGLRQHFQCNVVHRRVVKSGSDVAVHSF
jgi:hypothetical protein